ncbi:hypothetical protein C8J57DRAFT_1249728 [Mycena rebaudengoi]|nr:hypothetical protein C8J57DRAFT_1249728 [Mycena rebaudengoi]
MSPRTSHTKRTDAMLAWFALESSVTRPPIGPKTLSESVKEDFRKAKTTMECAFVEALCCLRSLEDSQREKLSAAFHREAELDSEFEDLVVDRQGLIELCGEEQGKVVLLERENQRLEEINHALALQLEEQRKYHTSFVRQTRSKRSHARFASP